VAYTPPRILLTLLAAAAFLPFLGRRDIVISHEARVVQTARLMSASGWPWNAKPVTVPAVHLVSRADLGNALRLDPDPAAPPLQINPWLVPVLSGEIRLQKPPLPYWCSAILFRLFGVEWSEALSRLIPALLGALATFLVADLARLTLGRRFALPAALVWVSSYFIPDEFRKAMADPYLAFFALLAIWAWISASIRHSRSCVLLFYIATALGLLAKGPPLFIHLAIPIALFHMLNRRRLPGTILSHLIGLILLAAIALPWPIYIFKTIPHAGEIWRYESIGEMADNTENAKAFYYYVPLLFQIGLPWTPLWIMAVALPFLRNRRHGRRRIFPLLWFFLTVIFFSAVHLKKAAYLLPAMPAQTLLIAQAIVYIIADLRRRRRMPRAASTEILVFASTLIVIAIIAFFNFVRTPIENARSPRLACNFIRLALAGENDYTVIPSRLPPEAALYLPLNLAFNPQSDTILYLIDDPKQTAKTDRQSFAQRLPDLNIRVVMPVTIPGAKPGYRYRLFRLIIGAGGPKNFADAD
jgi:4-amino-4-deoxy-L-arabinose transferase-like glycosyltransferase